MSAKIMTFYNEMTVSVNEVSAAHGFYLGFSEASGSVSHKLMKYSLDEWTVKCIENCLSCCIEGIVLSSTNFSWKCSSGLHSVLITLQGLF